MGKGFIGSHDAFPCVAASLDRSSPSTGTPWGTVGGFAVTLRRVGHGTSCPAGLFSEHPSPCSPATGALGKTRDRERNSVNRSVLWKLRTGAQAKGKVAVE